MAGDAGFDDVLGTRTPSPPPSVSDKPPCSERAWRASKGFLQRQQLPIMLVLAVLLGIAWPAPGVGVSVESSGVKPVSFTATIIIFFISGLQLTTDSLRKAITE